MNTFIYLVFNFACEIQRLFNARKFNKRRGSSSDEQNHNEGSVLPPTHLERVSGSAHGLGCRSTAALAYAFPIVGLVTNGTMPVRPWRYLCPYRRWHVQIVYQNPRGMEVQWRRHGRVLRRVVYSLPVHSRAVCLLQPETSSAPVYERAGGEHRSREKGAVAKGSR